MILPITFVRKGICLDYKVAMKGSSPQIPWVIDVLFFMHRTKSQQFYALGRSRYPAYVSNVGMVTLTVLEQIQKIVPYDENLANTIIAEAIIELCPLDARCLLEPGYAQALKIAEDSRYPADILDIPLCTIPDKDALREACKCPSCKKA